MRNLGTLISASKLAECLKASTVKLRVVDATWYLPNFKKTGIESYMEGHIPGAVFFDIDACCTPSPYEHMLPSEKQFSEYVGSLGIDNDTHVVVYNNHPDYPVFSAPRVWWTFRAFGHKAISILDGGMRVWRDAKYDIATGQGSSPSKCKYTAKFNPNFVKSYEDVLKNIETKQFQLIDARPRGRFLGTDPEPRPDIKPGHIPGAKSVPYATTFTSYVGPDGNEAKQGAIMNAEDLKKVFADQNIDLSKPVVASCGSGISACCLVLAAHLCGKDDVSVYDGAWVEWFKRSSPELRVGCPEN